MGKHNSSLTRVRPFFRALLEKDRTGQSWLAQLLALAPNRDSLTKDLKTNPGSLIRIDLDPEKKLFPPREFLEWLITNPETLTWPGNGKRSFDPTTQTLRQQLLAGSREVRTAALQLLAQEGVQRAERKWWAFEGCTFADCYLETDRLKLYVEGKRTETLSAATDWYPARNQLLRNLEVAQADAQGKPFACLLMVETPEPELTPRQIESGLPHMTEEKRKELLRHFLGVVTWREACEATSVPYSSLPDTVVDSFQ